MKCCLCRVGASWRSQWRSLAATWALLGGHCLRISEMKSLCVWLQIHQYNIQWHRDPKQRPEYIYCLLWAENKPAPALSLFYSFNTLWKLPDYSVWNSLICLLIISYWLAQVSVLFVPAAGLFPHLLSSQNKAQQKGLLPQAFTCCCELS